MLHAALLALSVLSAQDGATKPIDKEKARELMDGAHAAVSSAHLEIQVASLTELGELYRAADRGKAIEVLEEAFAGAYRLPDEKEAWLRSHAQGRIIQKLALIDQAKALEKLASLPATAAEGKVKPETYERVVEQLVSAGKLDQAVEVLAAYGDGVYPYRALNAVLHKMSDGDGRRLTLFGMASAAYNATPGGDFGEVILDNWEKLPRESVQAATAAIVHHLLEPVAEDQPQTTLRLGSGSDALNFTEQEFAVYKLLKVVQAVDPKRLDDIFEKRPSLKAAFAKAPGGIKEDKVVRVSSSGGDRLQAGAAAQQMAASMDQRARLRELAAKDPAEAMKGARAIPDADLRMQALTAVVEEMGEKDSKIAVRAAAEAFDAMAKARDTMAVALSVMGLMGGLMESIDNLKDPEAARNLVSKAIPVAGQLLKFDRDKESPNLSPRDIWPSTQAARMIMLLAGRALGTDAALLLDQWRDPDLRLVAQIALARALAGEMPTQMQIHVSRSGR